MKEDFSLCIPAKNRPKKLKILFSFLNKFNYTGQILIADASDKSLKKELESFLKDLKPNFTFKYFRAKNTPVLESLVILSKNVNTPFTMIIGDDDFIIPSAIKKACEILKSNSNFLSGVTGNAILLDSINFKYSKYKTTKVLGNNPYERIKSYLKNYWVISHTVLRTENLLNIFDFNNFEDIPIRGELGPCINIVRLGEVKKLHLPFLIRGVGHKRTVLPQVSVKGAKILSNYICTSLDIEEESLKGEIENLILNTRDQEKTKYSNISKVFLKFTYLPKRIIIKIFSYLFLRGWEKYVDQIKLFTLLNK